MKYFLGLGTVKWGRNEGMKYPDAYNLPSDATILSLLKIAHERGIRLIDTARAYGQSEVRLGRLLYQVAPRSEWTICSKGGERFSNGISHYDFSLRAITEDIETSLRNLGTDYLDIYLIHSNGDDESILRDKELIFGLLRMKEKGIVRKIGISTKTAAGTALALATLDAVMLCLNPLESIPLTAVSSEKLILYKKIFASGHLDKLGPSPIETSFQYIKDHGQGGGLILGTLNPLHLEQNIGAFQKVFGSCKPETTIYQIL